MNHRSVSISTYTPSSTDPALLRRIFVQRERLLAQITTRLARSMVTGDKHHILLVGPRGSGKTHLVTLAVHDLRSRAELSKVMLLAWLGEDDTFAGFIDIALGIADALAKEYPDEFGKEDFRGPVRGLDPDEAAESILNTILDRAGKRNILVVTENMDRTMDGLGDMGQRRWRAFLQEKVRMATLATAQQLSDALASRESPFFGFFDIHHLEPLTVEEARELIFKISTEQGKTELAKFVKSPEGCYRVRALHHLAGGNHRMCVVLAEYLTKDALDDLVVAFERLADELTPYFQERVRALPPQQAKLVECLCNADGAMTVKEISEETFIAERSCSKQLGLLRDKRYVRSQKRGKESFYDIAEPMMRLWWEVKSHRGKPLRLVARFLRAWFRQEQLKGPTDRAAKSRSRADEYRAVALAQSVEFMKPVAAKLRAEIEQCLSTGQNERLKTLTAELEFGESLVGKEAFGGQRVGAVVDGDAASRGANDIDRKLAEYTDVIGAVDASVEQRARALFSRGLTYRQAGDVERERADYSAVVDMADASVEQRAWALLARGLTYRQARDVERERADHSAVVDMAGVPARQRAWALLARGLAHGEAGDFERARADYSAVVDMADASVEQRAEALVNRGLTYGQDGDVERARADYSAVVDMADAPAEQRAEALVNRGLTYGRAGDVERELADYSAVVDMADAPAEQRAKALFNRGYTYGEAGDVERELADYSAVVSMADASVEQRARALVIRGSTRGKAGDTECALADYSAVIDMVDASVEQRANALVGRGSVHKQAGDVDRALADYSAVVDMADASVEQRAWALVNRGSTYVQAGDADRALADYSSVIDMADAPAEQHAKALIGRGFVYGQAGDVQRGRADWSAVVDMATAPAEQRAWALLNRSVLLHQSRRYDTAQADLELAIGIPNLPADLQAHVCFALAENALAYANSQAVKAAFELAFETSKTESADYCGEPQQVLSILFQRNRDEWSELIAAIVPAYAKYDHADALGQALVRAIETLNRDDCSSTHRTMWNAAWQGAGAGVEALELPLRALDAAVEVMNTRSDRPLFRLPPELRELVRPLVASASR